MPITLDIIKVVYLKKTLGQEEGKLWEILANFIPLMFTISLSSTTKILALSLKKMLSNLSTGWAPI